MSEPQRKSFDEATPGQEPGGGIADPATVAGGTIDGADPAAHADEADVDPGGYPHDPARSVPGNPADTERSRRDRD